MEANNPESGIVGVGRYIIDNTYKVHNIICKEDPTGQFTYDPFTKKGVLPFWGVMCTTFEGLNEFNKKYITDHLEEIGYDIQTIRLEKFWLFWFCDGSLEDQKELFFMGTKAKEHAYLVQHVFNSLLESNIDNIIRNLKTDLASLEG